MPYIGKSPGKLGVRTRYYYTATGSETSKSGPDDNGITLKFDDGEYVDVFLNGSLLVAGDDYNTATANTISGLAALAANDVLEVLVHDVYSLAKTNSEAQRTKYYKTAAGGETSITGTDDNGATITFSAGAQIDVRLNGVSLKQGDDYNTNTANTVGGLTALTAGQLVEIVVYEKFVLADMVKKSGDTMTGALTATSFYGDGSNLTGVGVDGITSNISSGTALTIDTNGNTTLSGDLTTATGDLRLQTASTNNAKARLQSLHYSSAYNLGVSGGAALGFEYMPGSDHEIFFETHNSGVSHREVMRIDKDGYVRIPYMPHAAVQYLGGGNGTFSGATVTFNTVHENIGNLYNSSNGRFTAPVAGRYLICVNVLSGVTNRFGLFNIRKNGSYHLPGTNGWVQSYNYGTTNDAFVTYTSVETLAANDYLDLFVHSSHNGFHWNNYNRMTVTMIG